MKKISFVLLVCIAVLFNACETDIETNAPWKDITVVYGLLDPQETEHYVKINRAFLGEGDANQMATFADSVNYQDGELDVTILEYDGSNLKNTYTLTRTVNDFPKNSGTFNDAENVLYKFTGTLDRDYDYKLNIQNNKSGTDITAETDIVQDIVVTLPNSNQRINLKNNSGTYLEQLVSITTGANIGRVQAVFIFNYIEYANDTVAKSIEMSLGELKTTTNQGNEKLEFTISGQSFFDVITKKVQPNIPGLYKRTVEPAQVKFIIAGEELNTYMEVNEPSNSVVQVKPEYTNIENGIGIFSSRTRTLTLGNIFHTETMQNLAAMGLDFCDPSPSPTNPVPCP